MSYDDWKTASPDEDADRYLPEPCGNCGETPARCSCDEDSGAELMLRIEHDGVYRCVLAERLAVPARCGRVVEVRPATADDYMATPLADYLAELDAIAASRSVHA